MTNLSAHLAAIIDIDSSTWVLFTLICGSSVWLMRNHLANILTVILIFPLVMFLSLAINYASATHGLFDPKKMSDWMIWTIMSATAGTMVGLAIIAVTARMWERQSSVRA